MRVLRMPCAGLWYICCACVLLLCVVCCVTVLCTVAIVTAAFTRVPRLLTSSQVTGLCDKLKAQASEGRAGTEQLSSQLASFQARIKDTTRKMMAIVSELSMYQATSIKLSQEQQVCSLTFDDDGDGGSRDFAVYPAQCVST